MIRHAESTQVRGEPRQTWGLHHCETHDREGDYALLADTVMEAFNPPDDDVAEESLFMDAIYAARDFIAAQPCACTPEMIADYQPCPRCQVLGRLGNKPHDR